MESINNKKLKTFDIVEYRKQYYQKNKDKLRAQKINNKNRYYEIIECDICHRKYQKANKSIHNKTNKHIIEKLKQDIDKLE